MLYIPVELPRQHNVYVHLASVITSGNHNIGTHSYFLSQVHGAPLKQLFGFQKVFLAVGQSVDLFFAASSDTFSIVDKEVYMVLWSICMLQLITMT